MCGISGIVNFHKKTNLEIVKKMNETITYRGPNHRSLWSNSFCSIGNVRLSIIDLSSNSNQPFVSSDSKISIIYNGEIYNFKKIKETYFPNVKFKSSGDGEVLLYLYEKYGIDFLSKIKGMFSIFISDEKKNKIYLIRDRFGIKPLYFSYNSLLRELTFCSEIPGIFVNKDIKKEQNFYETYKYLALGMTNATDETWFKNIYQVKPSHYLEFSKNGLKKTKYYNLEQNIDEDLNESKKTFFNYTSEINEKISNSFNEHTVYDVKGGIHQSGGLDSSLLVALAKEQGKNFDTFTFDFEHKQFSEKEAASSLAKKFKLNNYSATLKDSELINYLEKVVEIQYEPFSSLRVLSHHHLYEAFKNNCKVILDGSGGDEIFAGYKYHTLAWYFDMMNSNKLKNYKRRFSKIINKHESLNPNDFIKGSLMRLFSSGQATEDGSSYFDINYLNKDFVKKYNHNYEIQKPFKSFLRNAQYADLYHLKVPRSLRYIDRASMRYGIEARVPFLDHELVELMIGLPNEFKMFYGQQRAIIKYMYRKKINKEVLFKNKKTLADPQSFWLKNNLKSFVNDLLSSTSMKNNEFFNTLKIKTFFDDFCKSKKHVNSFFLFQVISTLLWQKNILGK
jgi:asparagine synthase (glutamine-hydrolysing)